MFVSVTRLDLSWFSGRIPSERTAPKGARPRPWIYPKPTSENLERYIDVTRGEILFAKGVLLVEGDAELFLTPDLRQAHGR